MLTMLWFYYATVGGALEVYSSHHVCMYVCNSVLPISRQVLKIARQAQCDILLPLI